jgi:hypothetical protein
VAFYPDLGNETQIARGPHVRAVGWLSVGQPFSVGHVAHAFAERLRDFAERWTHSVQALRWPVAAGFHECEFCSAFRCDGNFGVPSGPILFVCPEMIAHYVDAHAYEPPRLFIDAVLAGPLPGTEEYVRVVAPFAFSPCPNGSTCPVCRVELQQMSFANPVRYACPLCDHEEFSLYDPEVPELSGAALDPMHVRIVLPVDGSRTQHLSRLREFVAELRAVPLQELWARLRARNEWSLGVHPRYLATELVRRAISAGLNAVAEAA